MAERKGWSKGGVSNDAMKKRDDNKGNPYKSGRIFKSYLRPVPMFTPKPDAESCIRIVQPLEIDEMEYYGFEVHFHRSVGEDNADIICAERQYDLWMSAYGEVPFDKQCDECAKRTGDLWESDPDLAKTYYPDWRILFWVLDLKAKGDEADKIMLWSCPKTLADDILGQSHKKGTEVYVDVSHPETGTKVYFDREGEGKTNTKYKNVQVSDEECPLDDWVLDELKEFREVVLLPGEEDDTQEGESEGAATSGGGKDEGDLPAEVELECFGIEEEFDTYEDCDECANYNDCSDEVESKKKAKEDAEKPVRKRRAKRAEPAAEGDDPSGDDKSEVKRRMKEAMVKRKKGGRK